MGQTSSPLPGLNAKKRSKAQAGRPRKCWEEQDPSQGWALPPVWLDSPGHVRTPTGNEPAGFRHT